MKVNPKYFPHIILIAYIVGVIIAILLGFLPKHEGGEAFLFPIVGVGLFGPYPSDVIFLGKERVL